MGELKIQDSLYQYFFDLIKVHTGINLGLHKLSLVENRLKKRLVELGCSSIDEYILYLKEHPEEIDACTPLLTTHKTEWFREIIHFQWLQKEILSNRAPLSFWSAACSSGEEVYSLLFLCIKNGIPFNKLKILGSDISPKILQEAIHLHEKDAFKTQLSFLQNKIKRQISQSEIESYFNHSVKFKLHNLMSQEGINGLKFDVIFLRNVLIYFDRPTITKVISHLLNHLKPRGHLILGLSESIQADDFRLENLGNSIYHFKGF